jgi:L-threonylcarbamoyladenylate synthase
VGESASIADGPHRAATERLGADSTSIRRAAAILKGGGLVAFPTETVYGLGADARNATAVAALYAAKGRPRFNPLIAHVPSQDAARREVGFSREAVRLAEAFWPGPLTLVLPVSGDCSVSELARAGLDTLAVRIPSHPVARALLEATGFPVVAPSANRSGRLSPTEAAHVLTELDGGIDAVLDGGRTEVGVESTIVSVLDGAVRLLRPGGISRERLEEVIGTALEGPSPASTTPLAPGALASHYAPNAQVRLNADKVLSGEAGLFFGRPLPGRPVASLNLSPSGELVEAATNLFAFLRALDARGPARIAVAPIPDTGLGEAINDRLARAAADRGQSSGG